MAQEAANFSSSVPLPAADEATSPRPEFRPEATPARVLDFADAMRRVEDEVYNIA